MYNSEKEGGRQDSDKTGENDEGKDSVLASRTYGSVLKTRKGIAALAIPSTLYMTKVEDICMSLINRKKLILSLYDHIGVPSYSQIQNMATRVKQWERNNNQKGCIILGTYFCDENSLKLHLEYTREEK